MEVVMDRLLRNEVNGSQQHDAPGELLEIAKQIGQLGAKENRDVWNFFEMWEGCYGNCVRMAKRAIISFCDASWAGFWTVIRPPWAETSVPLL
jgi:hypothetical protein